jgi:RHS repeat-associated protein
MKSFSTIAGTGISSRLGLDLPGTIGGASGVGGLSWVCNFQSPMGTHFAAYDGKGNVVSLVSATTGTETARYEYGPFAEPIRLTGPAAALNPFRFSTKRTDSTTDLVLYEYGAYSPIIGRWLSRDPVEAIRVGFVAGQARGRGKAQASGACMRLSVHREGCPECF